MRLAVLSDIHANLAALEAVRDDLPPVDEVWVLGDIVGYGPQPNEVIAALQEIGARSVMGNHDGAAIGQVDVSWFNPDAARAIGWTSEVIDDNARAYLASLPEVRRDGELTAVHGSPRDPTWEYITTPLLIHNTAAILNNWGSEGWELVQIVQGPEGGLVAYLKRPVGGESSAAASAGAAAAAQAAKQFEGEGHA